MCPFKPRSHSREVLGRTFEKEHSTGFKEGIRTIGVGSWKDQGGKRTRVGMQPTSSGMEGHS